MAGIVWGELTGLYATVIAIGLGATAQALWLRFRSRGALLNLVAKRPETPSLQAPDLPAQIP